MAELLGGLIGGGVGITTVAVIIGSWALLLLLPWMAWSTTRNIKQIRIQLERLNDNIEARGAVSSSTNKLL
jgi:hypothetical protein